MEKVGDQIMYTNVFHKNVKLEREIMKNMKFQIIDGSGNIVDKNLSYEDALLYIDSTAGKCYIMEPMKEDD
jgi:hypothetical protein